MNQHTEVAHYTVRVQPYSIKREPYEVCGFWDDHIQALAAISAAVKPDVPVGWDVTTRCSTPNPYI